MKRISKKAGLVILIVLGVLVAIRAVLPIAARAYANHVLASNPDYQGHVGDIDLHLWRGACSVQNVELQKREAKGLVPYIDVKRINAALAWRELRHRRIGTFIEVESPRVTLADTGKKEPTKEKIDLR